MKSQNDINQEIDAILDSANGIGRAEVPTFFYTRLMGRLENRQESRVEKLINLFSRPVMAVSVLSVFLILNVVAIVGITNTDAKATSPSQQSGIQSFATEYNLNTATVYPNERN